MPTFYRPGTRKGNRTWVVRGNVAGRQHEVVTDATNKRAAEEAWRKFSAAAEQASASERRADQPVTPLTATVADAIDLYVEATRPALRAHKALDLIRADAIGGMLLADIGPEDLCAAARRLKPGAPTAQNRWVITPLAAALHMAHDRKLCEFIKPRRVREPAPKQPVAYPEETAAIADLCDDMELATLLLTMAVHGWRITETLMIERARVDWKRGKVERWITKSKRWAVVDLDPGILDLWRDLPEHADGRLFRFKGRWDVYHAVDKLLPPGKRWRPHMARRGFATAADEAGRSPSQIQAAGGWSSVQSVLRYIHVNQDAARATVAAVSKRAKRA